MVITGFPTVAEAQASVADRRRSLAVAVRDSEDRGTESLQSFVLSMAEAEGALRVCRIVASSADRAVAIERLLDALATIDITTEVARARARGFREYASRFRYDA